MSKQTLVEISGDGSPIGTLVTLVDGEIRVALPAVRFELRREVDGTVSGDVVLRVATNSPYQGLDVSLYTGPNALDVNAQNHTWKVM